jgi:hypothetical protein
VGCGATRTREATEALGSVIFYWKVEQEKIPLMALT